MQDPGACCEQARGVANLRKQADMSDSSADDAARKERERERKRKYYLANREQILADTHRRYVADPEPKRARARARYDADAKREYNRRYHEENRDRLIQAGRERYAGDPERYRAERRRYVEANREAINRDRRDRLSADPELRRERNEINRQYRVANAERLKQFYRRRNLKSTHDLDEATWMSIWREQQGKCVYCQGDLGEKAVVEHWHGCRTGHDPKRSCQACRRGLACQVCNVIIGFAKDDPDRLALIAANLRVANADVAERQLQAPQQLALEW